jgi:hypothetical protein
MSATNTSSFFTLLQREFREYRTSMFWTPIVTALILAILMFASVVLVNRISVIGDTILKALLADGGNSVNVTISVNEDTGEEVTIVQVEGRDGETGLPSGIDEELVRIERDPTGSGGQRIIISDGPAVNDALPEAPPPPPAPAYEVTVEEGASAEEWNFSREWTFNPERASDEMADGEEDDGLSGREFNVMLGVLHGLLLLLLLFTTFNYLLGSLYDDRKDRSILFWRSMPVSEREVVLSKFVMAMLVAPVIYIAVSVLLQLGYVLLMMAMVWRLGQDPFDVVVANIDFVAVLLDPISGWLMTALLIAPTYAWCLLASAFASRSPLWLAVGIPVALYVAEQLFFGTEIIGDAVTRHVPHLSDESSVGFYMFGPDWTRLDLSSVAGGAVFAALALAGAIWLRKHRWELT